jgi:hypothetical protein
MPDGESGRVVSCVLRDAGVSAHVGLQRLLLGAEGVEPVVQAAGRFLRRPLQQDVQRNRHLTGSSNMERGTKPPAKKPAAAMRGSTTASRMPMAITAPESPTRPRTSGSDRSAFRVEAHSGTASSTKRMTRRSTISSTGSAAASAPCSRSARAWSASADGGRVPLPGSSMVAAAKPFAAACRARLVSRMLRRRR